MRKHGDTKGTYHSHKAAIEKLASVKDMQKAAESAIKKNEVAIIALMKNIYWLAKTDCATSLLHELNDLCKLHGVEVLQNLKVDKHTNYEQSTSVL